MPCGQNGEAELANQEAWAVVDVECCSAQWEDSERRCSDCQGDQPRIAQVPESSNEPAEAGEVGEDSKIEDAFAVTVDCRFDDGCDGELLPSFRRNAAAFDA